MKHDLNDIELSVVLPCRNEEASIGASITEVKDVFSRNNIKGEIIVSDSSTDSSPVIANKHNVVLVKHDKEGYGWAYREGFRQARGIYIFCADPDGTYDFNEIPAFLKELRSGADMVIGDRFAKTIHDGAMPWLHRYIGNPVLSFLMRLMFHTKVRDSHCGMRAISRVALNKLHLYTTGMEFASEMIIQASRKNVTITQIPIDYHPRVGESKLQSFSDGWRHLRFMLLYSPAYLFFYPGLLLFMIGLISMSWMYVGNQSFMGITFFFHPMFISSLFMFIGYQLIFFALFARTFAAIHLGEYTQWHKNFYRIATMQKAVVISGVLTIGGLGIFGSILYGWVTNGFGELMEVKNSIVAVTLAVLGMQTIFSSFMISILSIKSRKR